MSQLDKFLFAKKFIFTAFFMGMFSVVVGQQFPKQEINFDEFIQKNFATQQSDVAYEEAYENLFQLYQKALNLNEANADELRNLYLLSELQINSLLAHRAMFGDFLTLYELQAVPYFDVGSIRKIAPFVEVRNSLKISDLKRSIQNTTEHYLVLRADQTLEQSAGFSEGKYLGSRQRLYTRYRWQHPKDFSVGFISEKDAGEKNVLDYTTFHLQLQNKGNLKNVILGDYQLQFGQGLVHSAGYFVGKGGEPIYTTRRANIGARPYNSLVEGGFFRGATATYQLEQFEVTAHYGYNQRDGSLDFSEIEQEEVFTSLSTSGFHRTESELARKNSLTEQNIGANVLCKLPSFQVGISLLNTKFDKPFLKRNALYNRFEFTGKENTLVGVNFTKNWQNFNFFGEVARSSSGGVGMVGGWVASLSPKIEWATNIRHYDKNFHSFYGSAFSEGSRPINEKGVYSGLKFTPNKSLIISCFYDRFNFPWLRYLVDAPSSGDDYLLRISFQPTKKKMFYAQWHSEQKQRNLPNNTSISDVLTNTRRQNFLVNYDVSPSRFLKFQSRVQYNVFSYQNGSSSKGYAIMQDVEGTIGKIQLKGRLAYYQTDDYDSRIYTYENDVLYAVSFPAYYGKGFRAYLVSRYAVSRRIDVWLRAARTNRLDGITIGSANDELPTTYKTDVRLQLRYRM